MAPAVCEGCKTICVLPLCLILEWEVDMLCAQELELSLSPKHQEACDGLKSRATSSLIS